MWTTKSVTVYSGVSQSISGVLNFYLLACFPLFKVNHGWMCPFFNILSYKTVMLIHLSGQTHFLQLFMAAAFYFQYFQRAHLCFWWPTCQQHFQQVWNGLNQICWQLPEGYFICSLLTVVKRSLFVVIGRWLHRDFSVSQFLLCAFLCHVCLCPV